MARLRRPASVRIRLTEDFLREIQAEATRQHSTVSDYIRSRIAGCLRADQTRKAVEEKTLACSCGRGLKVVDVRYEPWLRTRCGCGRWALWTGGDCIDEDDGVGASRIAADPDWAER